MLLVPALENPPIGHPLVVRGRSTTTTGEGTLVDQAERSGGRER